MKRFEKMASRDDRDRHQLGWPTFGVGGRVGKSRKHDQLAGVSGDAEATRTMRSRVRCVRSSRRLEEGDRRAAARSDLGNAATFTFYATHWTIFHAKRTTIACKSCAGS